MHSAQPCVPENIVHSIIYKHLSLESNAKMSNVYESMHEEALSRLCCVCGTIIKETFHYDVEKNLDLIRCGLNKPEFYPVLGATPWHFCKNCHLILRKLTEGKMIQTSLAMLNWQPCGIDCTTCLYLTKRKSSRGRPKKVIFCFCFPILVRN